SSIACCAPRFICSPMKANGPDIGPATATGRSCSLSLGALGAAAGALAGGFGVPGAFGGAPAAVPVPIATVTRNAATSRFIDPHAPRAVPHRDVSRSNSPWRGRVPVRVLPSEHVIWLAHGEMPGAGRGGAPVIPRRASHAWRPGQAHPRAL